MNMPFPLSVEYDGKYVVGIHFKKGNFNRFNEAERQLIEYLNGNRKMFTFPYKLTGTPFQKDVYKTLISTSYGSVISYGELAKRSGHEHAARAVGRAMNKNPLAILIPCHRVLPADRTLGKFGASIAIKEWLLTLEKNQG